MAAANTDKFRKTYGNFSTTLSGDIASDATTIGLSSASGLPTDTAVTLIIDRIDSDDEVQDSSSWELVTGVISGNNLTNALRGEGGTSASAHTSGAVVEAVVDEESWNDMISGLLIGHTQAGLHDFNGGEVILDSDGDSSFTADTDDVLDLKLANADKYKWTTTDFVIPDDGNIQDTSGTDPYKTISIGANGWTPATTSGCAAVATQEEGTNDIDYNYLAFDKDSDEFAFCWVWLPDNWDAGVVQFRYLWTAEGGGAAETVTFSLNGRSYTNDEAIDQAPGTAVALADTWIADGDVHYSAWSGDVTIAGATAGEGIYLRIMRDVSEDDLSDDARLIAVQIRYKEKQYNHF